MESSQFGIVNGLFRSSCFLALISPPPHAAPDFVNETLLMNRLGYRVLRANAWKSTMNRTVGSLRKVADVRFASSPASGSELFGQQAEQYAKFRPQYPQDLYDALFRFTEVAAMASGVPSSDCRHLAIDVACGSGQMALPIAEKYDKVLAFDSSPEQLKHAPQVANIEFSVATAEEIPVETDAADLVTVGQSLHWLDLDRFYAEAARVLHPSTGALAVAGYTHCVMSDPDVQPIVRTFQEEMEPYWDDRRALLDSLYEEMEPAEVHDEPGFMGIERLPLRFGVQFTLDTLEGYFSTWSSYQKYLKSKGVARGSSEDALAQLRQSLAAHVEKEPDSSLEAVFPMILILARRNRVPWRNP